MNLYYSIKHKNIETRSDNKCCILLTMYVKNNVELYEKRVKRWLDETEFDIFIVDSSGIGINQKNERLKQFVFEQDLKFNHVSVSVSEKNSILKASEYFNELLNYDIIFKITGKYFIPEFKSIIKTIPNDTDIVFQHLEITHGQNTELVGFKSELFIDIINEITENKTFEDVMYDIKISNKYKTYRFPMLKLDEYTNRSDGSTLVYL